MIDPITPAVSVFWQGKTYPLQLTLGALAGASGRLKIPILEGGPDSLDTLPTLAQRAVILYALIHRKFPRVTLEECEDAVVDPKRMIHYEEVCTKALEGVMPAVQQMKEAYAKAHPQTAADVSTESSGGDSGQSA